MCSLIESERAFGLPVEAAATASTVCVGKKISRPAIQLLFSFGLVRAREVKGKGPPGNKYSNSRYPFVVRKSRRGGREQMADASGTNSK